MRQGGVRPGGGNRVERQVAQQAAFGAEGLQPGRDRQFGLPALGCFDRQPVQEPRHGRAIAGLGIALAALFHRVLLRLGQDGGIGQFDGNRPGFAQRGKDRLDRAFGIDRHLAALHPRQPLGKGAIGPDRNGIAQVRTQFRRDLGFFHEQFGRAIGMGQHERQRHRRAIDILPPDVEQPGHAVERRDHRRIKPALGQPFGHLAALGLARLTGQVGRVDQRRGQAGGGTIGPDGIDRIAADRHQRGALGRQRGIAGIDPGLAMQPGIEADLRAVRGMVRQPGRQRFGRDRAIFEQRAIDLFAHLHGIAPVDKDRGPIGQDRGGSGRAAEPGQPGQPLGIAADIFAHVLVRDRDHEAIKPARGQFGAQRGQTIGMGAVGMGLHGGVGGSERFGHAGDIGLPRAARQRAVTAPF